MASYLNDPVPLRLHPIVAIAAFLAPVIANRLKHNPERNGLVLLVFVKMKSILILAIGKNH